MLIRFKVSVAAMIVLALIAGCGNDKPAVAPTVPTAAPATATVMPPTAASVPPTNTPIPPTEAATPTETATEADLTGDTWFKTYGGRQNDVCNDVLLADDGGFFIVGVTNLEFEPEQQGDVYLIRTNAAGDILWEKTYSGAGYEAGETAFPTSDGGLLISGATDSLGASGTDIYLIKVDQDGNELWSKTFGGPLDEVGAAWPADDGGYMLGGNIVDPNDLVVDNPGVAGYAGFAGRSNVYLARTDSDGNELWSRTFGGENNVLASSILPAPNGGFVILATIMYFPDNDDDIYLLKVDENGNEIWSRTWENGMSSGYDLVQTVDGGYLVTGPYSSPDDMDRTIRDFLFVKFDAQGNEAWMSTFGNPEIIDYAHVLAATTDGGYVAAGWAVQDLITWDQDIVIVKVDETGQLLWKQIIETDAHSMFATILQHPAGGYIIAGSIFNGRDFDVFVIKTDAQGNVTATSEPATAAPIVPLNPAAADDQAINAETVAQLEQVAAFDLPDSFVNTIVFSPDSRTLITGDRNGEVLLWDCQTWEKTTYLPARSSRAADSAAQIWFWGTLALSPDGKTIVTAYGDDGVVTGRDQAGHELFTFSYGARVYSVAISPDGQFLAVGGLKNNITVFDLKTRQPVADLSSDHERILHLGFSPNGKTLLANYHLPEHVFTAWDTATWQEADTFRLAAAPGEYLDYHDVLFSPDGKELVIASTERVEIKFLDLATKEIVREFAEHTRAPYQMAFSPDGSLLASASDDGTLRFWDMQTGVNVKTLWNRHEAGAVAFSPDGTLIAFSLWGEGVQVWAVAP